MKCTDIPSGHRVLLVLGCTLLLASSPLLTRHAFGNPFTPSETPTTFSLQPFTIGEELPNTLKGIWVSVDGEAQLAYVNGIMTGDVAVVSLAENRLIDVIEVTEQSGLKLPIFDSTNRQLYLVSMSGDRMWRIDVDTQEVAETVIEENDSARNGANPVRCVALDEGRQVLYLAVAGSDGTHVSRYDADLNKIDEILVDASVIGLVWDDTNDGLVGLSIERGGPSALVFVDGDDPSVVTTQPFNTGRRGSVLRYLSLDEEGNRYLAGRDVVVRLDDEANVIWRGHFDGEPDNLMVSGDEVGVLIRTGTPGTTDAHISRLITFDQTTGELMADRAARYEASRFDANPAGGFVVGNGGDASVSIFPAGTGESTFVRVGTAAEDVILTSDGERMLVLSRLGGSQLVEINLVTGEGRAIDVSPWPVAFAAREADDELFIFSHFESSIDVYRLSDLTYLRTHQLPVGGSVTDSIGEMVANSTGRFLAALIPELGQVVVFDAVSEEVVAQQAVGDPQPASGPAGMIAAFDGDGQRLFVYAENTLYRLDGPDYSIAAQTELDDRLFGQSARVYGLDGAYYSANREQLFVYNQIFDPETLMVVGDVDGADRIVAELGGVIYGQERLQSGEESLVFLDTETLEVIDSLPLLTTDRMVSSVAFDFENNRLAVTQAAQGEILLF